MKALNRTALIAAVTGLFAASLTSSTAWAAITPVTGSVPYSSANTGYQGNANYNHSITLFPDVGTNTNGGVTNTWSLSQSGGNVDSSFNVISSVGSASLYLEVNLTETTNYLASGTFDVSTTPGTTGIYTQFMAGSANYSTDSLSLSGGTRNLSYGPFSGTLAPGNYVFMFDYELSSVGGAPTATGIGNFQMQLAPVPEPASLGVLALGGVGLLSRRRAQRSNGKTATKA